MAPPSQPHLVDARGKHTIGVATNAEQAAMVAAGATSVIFERRGELAGYYFDNETGTAEVGSKEQIQQRDTLAKRARAQLPPSLMVVVALYPRETRHRISGCICALEWYPYHQYDVLPPRSAQGYILQWDFTHEHDRPATHLERARLLHTVSNWHPILLWTY